MAPEQAERSEAVDYRADLYAIGATLFRLLCGRAPLAAAPNMSLLEKVRMLAEQNAPRLSSLREDVPAELVQLVATLLSRQPSARPASAAHVAEALQPFCTGANLPELLALARRNAQQDESVEDLNPGLREIRSSNTHNRLAAVGKRTVRKLEAFATVWTAAVLIPLAIAAGILITLETQKGLLVIQSDSEVQVKIAKDGTTVKDLTVLPGATTTRLRADKYEITLVTPSDSISIDKDQFTLKSSGTVVATVKHESKPDLQTLDLALGTTLLAGPSQSLQSVPASGDIYNGKPLAEWLSKYQRERDDRSRQESVAAIAGLTDSNTIEEIAPILLKTLRESVIGVDAGLPGKFWQWESLRILRSAQSKKMYFEMLAKEFERHDPAWTLFLLGCEKEARYESMPQLLIEQVGKLLTESKMLDKKTVVAAGSLLVKIAYSFPDAETASAVSAPLSLLKPHYFFENELGPWPDSLADFRREMSRRVIADENAAAESAILAIHFLLTSPYIPADVPLFANRMELLLADQNRMTATASARANFRQEQFPVGFQNFIEIDFSSGNGANQMLELLFASARRNLGAGILPTIKHVVDVLSVQSNAVELADYFSTPSNSLPGVRLRFPQMEIEFHGGIPHRLPKSWQESSHEQRMVGLILAYARRTIEAIEKIDPNQSTVGQRPQANSAGTISQATSDKAQLRPPENLGDAHGTPSSTSDKLPIHSGRTLEEWFDVLERDRDTEIRRSAIRAIGMLTPPQDNLEISRKLLTIAKAGKPNQWMARSKNLTSIDVKQFPLGSVQSPPPSVALDTALWSVLTKINSPELVAELLKSDLLTEDVDWTKRWLIVLVDSLNFRSDDPIIGIVTDWLLKPANVERFDQSAAAQMREFLLHSQYASRDVDEARVAQMLNTIRASKLGVRAVLTSWPKMQFFQASHHISMAELQSIHAPALMIVEQAVMKIAVEVLLNQSATPEELTVAACRIASGPDIDPTERDQIISRLGQLISTVATDADRRTAVQQSEYSINIQTKRSKDYAMWYGIPILPSQNVFVQPSEGSTQSGAWRPIRYVDSEILAYLALARRLSATVDLRAQVHQLLLATEEACVTVEVSARKKYSGTQLQVLSATWPMHLTRPPLESITRKTWIDAFIYVATRDCFDTELQIDPQWMKAKELFNKRLKLAIYDRDSDDKLSASEAQDLPIESIDANEDGYIDVGEIVLRSNTPPPLANQGTISEPELEHVKGNDKSGSCTICTAMEF